MLQAVSNGEVVGAIVCKLDVHKKVTVRGYIAMLAVDHRFRKRKIGKLAMYWLSLLWFEYSKN